MQERLAAVAMTVVAVLLAAACSGDGDSGEGTVATTTTTTSTGATDATGASDPTTTTTAEAIRVVLGAGRLTIGGNALVVGAPASQVDAYLERALGDADDVDEQDCDPGRLRVSRWPGLSVYVYTGADQQSGFGGWYADDDTFATDKGIRVGSTAESLRSAYPDVEISESTLGTEAFVPDDGDDDDVGLSAVLEGDRISDLWSGATCVAR